MSGSVRLLNHWLVYLLFRTKSFEELNIIPRIVQKFNLTETKVNKVLEFLTKSGLGEVTNHFYKTLRLYATHSF
jgi:hypothetical protein